METPDLEVDLSETLYVNGKNEKNHRISQEHVVKKYVFISETP